MKPDLKRLLDFQKFLGQFSHIERMVHRRHNDKFIRENDTEHSYNLAMTAWFVASHFPELNKDKVIKYGLVHDIVEIHAGDTYIYGTADEIASKSEREAKALQQLKQDWPDFPDLTDYLTGYEERVEPEARFVYALDKVMPIMLIFINEGYTWDAQKVTLEMLHHAKADKVAVSPEIQPYYDQLYKLLLEHPELIKKS